MSLLGNLLLRQRAWLALAHPDAYGEKVLIAWEFDPEVFMDLRTKILNEMRKEKIPYDLLHDEKASTFDKGNKLWTSRGNDWSHVSVLMLRGFNKEDEAVVEDLAKAHTPTWSAKEFSIFEVRKNQYFYVILKVNYPKEATDFEAALRKHIGNRVEESQNEFVPHVSLFGIRYEDKSKVEEILKNIELPNKEIPTHAIQVWLNFQVVDHILL